jgi:cytochrome c biogenesis protein CcmG/thiol:disulfide interchange protein DsbE
VSRSSGLQAAVAALLLLGPALAASAAPPLDLSPYAGRVIYVDFWASWCAPCKASLPWLQDLQGRRRDEGLTVLLVNVDRDRKAAEAMLARQGVTLPVAWDPDGKIAQAYALEGMPSSFVYGRDGRLRDRHVGFDPRHADELERSIAALLAEPAPRAAGAKEGGS